MSSILNSNNIFVRFFDLTNTKPETLTVTDSWANTGIETTDLADGGNLELSLGPDQADGTYIILNSLGRWAGVVNYSDTGSNLYAYTTISAATSATLDMTNSQNDVARDAGLGGLIQESDNEWSISIDGLVQDANNDTGRTLVDEAIDDPYLVVSFQLDGDNSKTYVGLAKIDNISFSGSVDEAATYSATLQGVDKLYVQQD